MRRLLVFLPALAAPIGVAAAGEKVYRLGELEPTEAALELTHRLTLPELAKLGFSEGRNLVLDGRVGDPASIEGLAQELLRGHPDAIIAVGGDATRVVRQATSTVPIVSFGADPVRLGFAASLAHPGGNVTGVAMLFAELDGKRLDLLHEAVPAARRVAALLATPRNPGRQHSEYEIRQMAANVGVDLLTFEAAGPEDYPTTFTAMREAGAQALVIMSYPAFYRDAGKLAQLALEAGLPTVCEWAEMAHSGCLLGYGPSRPELRRRMAHYIAQIFLGAAPSELPIEQPTHYEFAINLKTASALGLTMPPAILARADEVIE